MKRADVAEIAFAALSYGCYVLCMCANAESGWPLLLFGLIPALLIAFGLPRARRRWVRLVHERRLQTGYCVECGYDLRGTIGRCPECGHHDERRDWSEL